MMLYNEITKLPPSNFKPVKAYNTDIKYLLIHLFINRQYGDDTTSNLDI